MWCISTTTLIRAACASGIAPSAQHPRRQGRRGEAPMRRSVRWGMTAEICLTPTTFGGVTCMSADSRATPCRILVQSATPSRISAVNIRAVYTSSASATTLCAPLMATGTTHGTAARKYQRIIGRGRIDVWRMVIHNIIHRFRTITRSRRQCQTSLRSFEQHSSR